MNDNEQRNPQSYFEYDYPYDGKETGGRKRFGWGAIILTATVFLLVGALAASLVFMSLGYRKQSEYIQPPKVSATPQPGNDQQPEGEIPRVTPVPTPVPEDTIRDERPVPKLGSETAPIIGTITPVVDINDQVSPSVVNVTSKVDEYSYVTDRYIEVDSSLGSGLILTADGYIVTNYHIIERANNVYVTVGGSEYKAEVIGSDASVDLAVLKIQATGLKAAALGDSSKLKVGETAIAIGNALGTLTASLTQGVISGLDREINTDGRVQTYIQTDAAINPGNSGGPLLDGRGLVIGICSLKTVVATYDEYGNAIAAEGLGYAIPINDVLPVVEQLIQYGYIPRPAIGILAYEMTQTDAEEWEMPKGVLVTTVKQTGPSYGKLIENDVITGFDGIELESFSHLTSAIKAKQVGDTILLKIWREGKTIDVTVEIGDSNKIDAAEEELPDDSSYPYDFEW